MARYSAAYSILTNRLKEVRTLQKIAASYSRKKPLGSHDDEVASLCRSATVLLCAHIEGYSDDLSKLIIERISEGNFPKNAMGDAFRYYFSQDIIAEIRDTREPARIAIKITDLVQRDREIWSEAGTFPSNLNSSIFMRGFSTPRPTDIYRLFRRFGFDQIKSEMASRLRSEFQFCENMVETIVDDRNKIAHGDYQLAKSPSDIQDMILKARSFCRTADICVANACKQSGFSIR